MRRTTVVLSAAAILAAAFGLSGCGNDDDAASSLASSSSRATEAPVTTTVIPPASQTDPLPDPAALTAVLYKLADINVAGADKLGVVEGATTDDAAAIDKFGNALKDGGFTPLTFEAIDLAPSDTVVGNVVATVNVTTEDPAVGAFSFPMEFKAYRDGWQLSRETGDMLLAFGDAQINSPPPTPPR